MSNEKVKAVNVIKKSSYMLIVYNVYNVNTINNLINLRDALSCIIDYKDNPTDFNEWIDSFKGMISVDMEFNSILDILKH